MARNNRKAVQNPQVEYALDQFKNEVAQELGIQTGADQTSRNNGAVGGHMVRKMIQLAESQLVK